MLTQLFEGGSSVLTQLFEGGSSVLTQLFEGWFVLPVFCNPQISSLSLVRRLLGTNLNYSCSLQIPGSACSLSHKVSEPPHFVCAS